jgi:hypothetical protein
MPRILFLSPLPSWRRTSSSRRRRFFIRVFGELGVHYIAVERALLVEQGRRGRAEAVRAVVAAGASIAAHIRSALFSVLSDIGTPSSLDVQQIADLRRAISAFGVGLAPSATESPPEVVQHEVSVSLGIVGHNGWGTHDKTLP